MKKQAGEAGVVGDELMGKVVLESGRFGVSVLLTNLRDVSARDVYLDYKGRWEIEQAFDFMKNDLEADRLCLGCDEAVRGFFVVVFLTMRRYFKILRAS